VIASSGDRDCGDNDTPPHGSCSVNSRLVVRLMCRNSVIILNMFANFVVRLNKVRSNCSLTKYNESNMQTTNLNTKKSKTLKIHTNAQG